MKIDKQFLSSVLSSNDVINTIANLSYRWADEKEYEDIKDYAKPILSVLNKKNLNIEKLSMTKKPFGFKANLMYTYQNGLTLPAELQVKMHLSGKYEWNVKFLK